jgi:hypothetical protein
MSTESSMPGPHIDLVPEMIAWWDRWLRNDETSPAASWPKIRTFMRRPTHPEPDLRVQLGEWRSEPEWPIARGRNVTYALGDGPATIPIRGDVGFYGSIWCAGTLPWGPPMDQREDDARSLTIDFERVDRDVEILGHPRLEVTVRSSVPVTYLSAKLCDVFPDATSALVSRGILNLTHRDSHTDPKPLEPGEAYTIALELDATSWIFEPGHTIRLSLATSDWPSSWAPPLPGELTIERTESRLVLPVLDGPPVADPPEFSPPSGRDGRAAVEEGPHDVTWRIEHDVLARQRHVVVEYGSTSDPGDPIRMRDLQRARLSVSTRDPGQSRFEGSSVQHIAWPEADVEAVSRLVVDSDANTYRVELELDVTESGRPKWTRRWERVIPRNLQ